mmetsp:Transcript_17352/g.45466  ORF Transcript_17352/g.45466 Transcript_17352/m.45466 type:complete len:120 (-) Transcript_17352:119-478(-)
MVQTPKHRAPSGQQLWQSHQTSSSSDVCMCMCPERGGGALGKGGGCTTLTHSPLFSTAAAAPPGTPAHPPVFVSRHRECVQCPTTLTRNILISSSVTSNGSPRSFTQGKRGRGGGMPYP